MTIRLTDMRSAVSTGATLIPFAAGTYRAGDLDPDIKEPMREIRVDQKFLTFPGEMTNADVRQITDHMTPARKFGVFVLDSQHGPILEKTSPDESESHFELVEPNLYRPEIGIKNHAQQIKRFAGLTRTGPIQIIPDADRYETWPKWWPRMEARHFVKDEMAATIITYWQAQALAMFTAGAMGLSGASDLMSSDQFDVLVQGLKFMTSTGELTNMSGWPLRAFGLKQIVPVNAASFPALQNGIRPNTTWNWTRTEWQNKDGGPFSLDLKKLLLFVYRGGSWEENNPKYLRAASRGADTPVKSDDTLGFRVAVSVAPQNVDPQVSPRA